MANVWVYREDGTKQCGMGIEETLQEARADLESRVGKVERCEKRQLPFFYCTGCGSPTGQVNAFEITTEQYEKLIRGIVGPGDFRLWDFSDARKGASSRSGEVPVPFGDLASAAALSSVARNPVLVRELLGRPVRVYKRGDALTKDYRPERVNILVDDEQRIVDISFF